MDDVGSRAVLFGVFLDVLATRGRTKEGKSRHDGPKMGHDSAKMGHDSAKMAILGSVWELFGWSWDHLWSLFSRSLEKWPKCKNEQHYSVLAAFWGLGWSGWRLLRSVLGDLGHKLGSLGVKLGTSWQHVGTKMAKDGLRWPT